MSEDHSGESASGAIRHESGHAPALGAADWLGLAVAPTFAIMALLTGVGGGPPDMLCSAAQAASPVSGMVPMYLLMSAFHSAPWLKLISSRRSGALRPRRVGPPARRRWPIATDADPETSTEPRAGHGRISSSVLAPDAAPPGEGTAHG